MKPAEIDEKVGKYLEKIVQTINQIKNPFERHKYIMSGLVTLAVHTTDSRTTAVGCLEGAIFFVHLMEWKPLRELLKTEKGGM